MTTLLNASLLTVTRHSSSLLDMRTKDEIRALLDRLNGESADALEDEELEFKLWEDSLKSLFSTLREAVVCLANARGGWIVVGVRDKAKTRREAIQGAGQCDLAGIRRAIYDGTDPHILIEVEELIEVEGRLLLIHVPRGIPPHTTSDGIAKIRIGKECKPLTGQALARLLASGGQRDPTAEMVPSADKKDLDPEAIAALRAQLEHDPKRTELSQLSNDHLLETIGLISSEGLTLAGLLLAGKMGTLSRLVPQHEVTFIRFKNATRYDQRRDLHGPLLLILKEMEQLVSVNNRVKTVQERGFGQLELPDLSWEVAREAVLNAVTHRDYFMRQGVQIALHQNRLEITGPGGFVGGVTPDNILRHPPVHRNELLARAFQSIGLVNRVGLGVDRIFKGLLLLGKDSPRYTSDEAHVRLTIPLETHAPFALFLAEETRRGHDLDLDDLLILRAFVRTSSLDRWSAAKLLQLSEEEAAAKLMQLREAGYLVVRGRGRGTSYEVRRELAERFRGRSAVDADIPIEEEGVRLRITSLLRERGRLTNAEIRRFSGFSRVQVYRITKRLATEGAVRFAGKGRGACILPGNRQK